MSFVLMVEDVREVSVSFEVKRDGAQHGLPPLWISFKAKNECDVSDPYIHRIYALEIDQRYDYSEDCDFKELHKTLSRIRSAIFIKLSNGIRYFIFCSPLEMKPSKKWAEEKAKEFYVAKTTYSVPNKKFRSKVSEYSTKNTVRFYCLEVDQHYGVTFALELPKVNLKEKTWNDVLEISYNKALTLSSGTVLCKPSPFTRASHPRLPGGKKGVVNCITDFWRYVIPLKKPCDSSSEPCLRWSFPLYAHIQSLKTIPCSQWDNFISYFEGKEIGSISDFVTTEVSQESETRSPVKKTSHDSHNARGKCFYHPAARIRLVSGIYIVFELKIRDYIASENLDIEISQDDNRSIFIIDSLSYGVALRIADNFPSASSWVNTYPHDECGVLKRICHDEQDRWQEVLKKYIQAQILIPVEV